MIDYASNPAVNWSTLKYMRESPMLYRYRLSVPREDTPALALGRATHTLVFEPELFDEQYVIWEGGRRAGNAWSDFVDAHPDQTILRTEDADQCAALAEAVRRHPLVQPYLRDGGEFERAIEWTDAQTGLRCKGRPDWLIPDRRILLDLKTCMSIDGRRFGAIAARFQYHAQLAMYRAGVAAALGWEPQRVLIVAVEKDAPYDVGVFELDQDALYAGAEEVAELLRALKVCRETDTWPGRYTEEQALQLPAWMFTDDEEDPESMGLITG